MKAGSNVSDKETDIDLDNKHKYALVLNDTIASKMLTIMLTTLSCK